MLTKNHHICVSDNIKIRKFIDIFVNIHKQISLVFYYVILLYLSGIRTPTIFMVDMEHSSIYMEYIDPSITVKDYIANIQSSSEDKGCLLKLAQKLGQLIGKSHGCNVIHGDLTSSNMLLTKKAIDHNEQEKDVDMLHTDISKLDIVLIDFGLASLDGTAEDKAVDLYVLERALLSTHSHVEYVFKEILTSYYNQNPDEASQVIKKLDEVRLRGRKRTMVG